MGRCVGMTYYRIRNSSDRLAIGKLICLARTYKKHAEEMNAKIPDLPLLFLKPESAVIFSNQSVILPPQSQSVHHEVELGVVIGKKGKDVSVTKAMDYVYGYLVGLDITARDIQTIAKQNGWPWSIAKGFDTFAPISDVVLKEEISDPHNIEIVLQINQIMKQRSNTKHLVFPIPQLISFISSIMTIKAGDLILTGTPEGVGKLHPNDSIVASLGPYCDLCVDVQRLKR